MFRKFLFTTAAILSVASAPAFAQNANGADQNIVEIASSQDQFSTLETAIKSAGLAETLQNADDVTIFAPTNEAFENLPEGTLEALMDPQNKQQLAAILTYHVLPSNVMASDIEAGNSTVATMQGTPVLIRKSDQGVMVNNATVTQADIQAENGVIHVVNAVIAPPQPQAQQQTQ